MNSGINITTARLGTAMATIQTFGELAKRLHHDYPLPILSIVLFLAP